tara:strand:- start:66 stop:641 length:576 start_codon:yes stop_codon:yes gene_type:complete
MVNIVELFEKIQNNKGLFNIIDMSRRFSYLKKFNKKDILIIGSGSHPKYITLDTFELKSIERVLDKHKLIVLDKYTCRLSNSEIKNILNLLNTKKKDFIFVGYSCYCNCNIDNSNKLFRPIDITKYPFNQKNHRTIYKNVSIKLIILYIFCLIAIFVSNKKDPRLLYKFVLVILILSPLVFPMKKVLYIKN